MLLLNVHVAAGTGALKAVTGRWLRTRPLRVRLERLFEARRQRGKLVRELVESAVDRVNGTRVVGARLHLDLDGGLKRVWHTVPRKVDLLVLQQLPARG